MKQMRHIILPLLILLGSYRAVAQQEVMVSQYMFNRTLANFFVMRKRLWVRSSGAGRSNSQIII